MTPSSDFNSHAPCGARRVLRTLQISCGYFNSHAPCGARRLFVRCRLCYCQFQLTRPLRGATEKHEFNKTRPYISTHTPLAGRDLCWCDLNAEADISTHTPLAGRDEQQRWVREMPHNFNSHAPCGARPVKAFPTTYSQYFNSHAPCGARLICFRKQK